MNADEVLFPYETLRKIQAKLLAQSQYAILNKKNLIAHAPTGTGKTAAVLAPALKYAIENDKTVFFLTSRHTQHQIAIDTLKAVKNRHNTVFSAVDIIGKKWLCLQPGVTDLMSGEFTEYCRKMREDNLCEFYSNLKKGDKLSSEAKRALITLKKKTPQVTEQIVDESSQEKVCPYEISMMLSKDSHVIVTDYFYIYNPKIRESFLKRAGKELEDCIIIVDEAHNLPSRLKDLSTQRLTNIVVKRAISEAEKEEQDQIANFLTKIDKVLFDYYENCKEEEMYVKKSDFWEKINRILDYDELVEELVELGGKIREEKKRSYIAVVGEFLQAWAGGNEGFTRILAKSEGRKGPIITLSYRCLDPSLITKDVNDKAHCTIAMSGTLTPTHMYKELLGFEDAVEAEHPNPFPVDNLLSLIVPRTSTKYSTRSEKQYEKMAGILSEAVNEIPGNSIIFFPSYHIKDCVHKYLDPLCKKTVFNEVPGMSKGEKHDFLDRFKKYKEHGAVMLGVISGSFGEGIDLPGDYLKGVIIVGLPLQKPDLEAKSLIDYYDKKFGKGWDYGYVFPAFNKTMQSAGRCIRSETDRGVVLFLDERYSWDNYRKCFPSDLNPKITMMFKEEIRSFFDQ